MFEWHRQELLYLGTRTCFTLFFNNVFNKPALLSVDVDDSYVVSYVTVADDPRSYLY